MNCQNYNSDIQAQGDCKNCGHTCQVHLEAERSQKICKRCAGALVAGRAIAQTYVSGVEDFASDEYAITFSAGGPGELVACLKCAECGWSMTQGGDQ